MKYYNTLQTNDDKNIRSASASLLNDIKGNKISLMVISGSLCIGYGIYKLYKSVPKAHSSIPTAPETHPLFGHIPFFQNNYSILHDKLYELIKNYEIVTLTLPGWHDVFLNTPELIEWAFTTEFDSIWKTDMNMDKFQALFGKYGAGIFTSDGTHWRFHRKIGSRMFSTRNLRDYMYKCVINTTKSTLNVLQTLCDDNIAIDINDILGRMTFDCFTTIAFGQSFDSMSLYPQNHPFGKAFDKIVELIPMRMSQPFWKVKRFLNIDYEKEIAYHLKIINDFSHNLITEKRKNTIANITDETGINTFDLFSLYQKHNQQLTDNDMKYLALNFIIAGRDTTRMLISWFLYDLSIFSEIKKKVIKEIDEYKYDQVNYKDITCGFKYLEATLCESLRYHPVVPTSARRAKEDIVIPNHILPGNYVIKKHDVVTIHQFTVSKLERFYKNAKTFDPMRFYEKGVRTFKQSVYPFFNQFPRLCLGRDFALMEAKIFIFYFLRKYEFDILPNQEINYAPGIIFNMKNGLKINLKLRE
eukprot:134688_1